MQKLISIALFKKIARIHANDVADYIKSKSSAEVTFIVKDALTEFFNDPSETSRRKLYPYAVYVVKLLFSKYDVLRKHNATLKSKNPWIEIMLPIASVIEEDKHFAYLEDKEFNEKLRSNSHILGNLEEFFKSNKDPLRKMTGLIYTIENTYFIQRPLEDERILNYLMTNPADIDKEQ